MYTDEKRRGGLLKDFILKLILIIIFVLLLIWLVPWPNMDSLNPLKDQIFNSNLQTMKEAAIPYFTTERLPQEVGDKTTLTLQKMLDMKLLIPFTDKNGKSCDVKKSYVSLEKKETEYLMKVNLKCGEEEDYILVHLGCYSYCTTDICEAKPGKTEKPSTTPIANKPTVTPTQTTKPTQTPTQTVKPTVTPTQTTTPTPTQTVKPTVTPTVTPTPTPTQTVKPTPTPTPRPIICSVVNGIYYDNKGNVTTQANYNNVCNVIIVNPTPTPTQTTTPTPVVNKECEWKKDYAAKYTDWTDWVEKVKKTNDGVVFELTDTKQTVDLGTRYVQIGTTAAVYQQVKATKTIQDIFGYYDYKVCTNYSYAADSKTIYRIDSDWEYASSWYQGYNPPADTIDTRWIFQGIDYSQCGNDCTNHPFVIYRKQVRKVTAYTEYSNVTASCTNVETRSIPVYGTRTISELKQVLIQPEQAKYGYVRYYKYRTRTLLKEAYTEYRWIDCTQSLKDAGYTATGKTRNK